MEHGSKIFDPYLIVDELPLKSGNTSLLQDEYEALHEPAVA
jgi:hypothetical protein